MRRNKKRGREGDRVGKGCSTDDDLRDVHEFHAQCAIDMAVSHNLDTGDVIPVIVLFLRRHRRLPFDLTVSLDLVAVVPGDKGNTFMAIESIEDVFTGNGMRF